RLRAGVRGRARAVGVERRLAGRLRGLVDGTARQRGHDVRPDVRAARRPRRRVPARELRPHALQRGRLERPRLLRRGHRLRLPRGRPAVSPAAVAAGQAVWHPLPTMTTRADPRLDLACETSGLEPRPPGTFEVLAQDPGSPARAGRLWTAHGPIDTPCFMPVGTYGAVKGLDPDDLREV